MNKLAACFLVIFAIILSTTAAFAGSISGTVTGPDGETPLAGIGVSLFVWNGEDGWDWISGGFTDDIGQYEISELEAGAYRIGFWDDSSNYLTEIYDNALDLDMGADIAVAAEGVTDGINASLAAAAKITGTVTGPDGTTVLEGIQVVAYSWNSEDQWWDWIQSANTDAAGEYEIGGLAAGIYRVQFFGSGYYQGQVYNGAANLDEGLDVVVPAATTVANINASLAAVGKISGTVTGTNGSTGLQGVYAGCYFWNGLYWEGMAGSHTDEDGRYEIDSLAAGTYRVVFYDMYNGCISETYNDVSGTEPANGTDVVVVVGETTAGIDASLTDGAEISGTVTGPDGMMALEGIYVGAYSWNSEDQCWDGIASADTAADGRYVISNLAAGTYRVQFFGHGDYLDEVYNDVADLDAGQDISVPASATVENIDASLAMASKISGMVTGPDGTTALEGIHVVAYSRNSEGWWDWVGSANTDAAGEYEIRGLTAGTYRVQFDGSGYYQGQVYSGAANLDEGWDVVVPASATVEDINATLAAAGKIAGTVTGMNGSTGLQDIYARSYLWNGSYWALKAGAFTDEDGRYEIDGLAAGTYRVVFYDWNGGYLSETYDDVPGTEPDNGTDVVVVVGETTAGIDASLTAGGAIAGTVTGPGAEALANVDVEAYRWDGGSWIWEGGARTDADGHYEIGELSAGTYRLDFRPGGNYVPASLDGVALAAESESENNNITLQVYARLLGTVFLADGVTPVGGVRVYVRKDASNMVWRQSGADGSYAFSGLRPGNYSVVAAPSASLELLGEWYDDAGLYVPGQDAPPPEAAVIALDYGDVQTGIDFDLDPAGRISGTVTDEGGAPLAGAYVKAKNSTHGLICMAQTDDTGAYELMGLLSGDYKVKAGAEDYRDEWWSDATHEDQAVPIAVASGSDLARDFVLLSGQNPALVEIVSDPSGAAIYLDYQATTYVTPALVDVGEVASHAPRMGGWAVASHVVTLKKAGHPRSIPRVLPAVEAETVSITIDMTSTADGGLSVVTDPADAEVYVDCADVADGLTPLVVGSLAPGSHIVLLKKPGYLQARPIVAHVEAGATNEIVVPLAPVFSPDRIMAEVQSSPTGAVVYVDYFPTTAITDAVIDWMDPASHSGSGWHSASHTVMLRKFQKLPGAPRYVPDATNAVQTNLVRLIVDVGATVDGDGDGLPDSWEPDEDEYPGWGGQGPDDDYDGDGVSNFGELIAGTHPGNPDSTFEIDDGDLSSPGNNDSFALTFKSVPGRMYFIRGKTSMSPNAEWVNLTGIILATGFETTRAVQFPEGEAMRFFQLVVWNP